MSNLLCSYDRIHVLLYKLESDDNFLNQVCLPKPNWQAIDCLKLGGWSVRQAIAHQVVAVSEHHIIDSMPVEVCKFARSNRSKFVVTQSNNHGYCAAQKTHYFGYKLHAVCTVSGIFKAFDITKASAHDIHFLNDVKAQFSNCVLIGDRGYLSRRYINKTCSTIIRLSWQRQLVKTN